jgi:hypothetical protein
MSSPPDSEAVRHMQNPVREMSDCGASWKNGVAHLFVM